MGYIHVLGGCRKDKVYLHSKSVGLGLQKCYLGLIFYVQSKSLIKRICSVVQIVYSVKMLKRQSQKTQIKILYVYSDSTLEFNFLSITVNMLL